MPCTVRLSREFHSSAPFSFGISAVPPKSMLVVRLRQARDHTIKFNLRAASFVRFAALVVLTTFRFNHLDPNAHSGRRRALTGESKEFLMATTVAISDTQ